MKIAKVFIMSIMLLFASVITYAAPIDNVTSSAFMPGDSAIFNLDFIDPFGLPFFNVMINAKFSGIIENRIIPMTHTDADPHYLTTYVGSAVFDTPAASIEYYGRVEADTFVVTQSYMNTANQFPPDSMLYARLANDAIGDTAQGSAGPFLDLTGGAITYSDTKIFAKLNNVGGGWPRNQGLTTYYIYGFFLGDPDTITTSITAMIYSSVPVLLPSGLYNINLADTSFQQLGNIQSQTSGNTLHMSCNIADLLTDPSWPVWPPQQGFILGLGFTLTLNIANQGIIFNDYSYPSAFIPMTQYLSTFQNHTPAAFLSFTIPPGRDSLFMGVSYADLDNNLPVIRQLTFDGDTYTLGSFNHQYGLPGSDFIKAIPWPGDGWHHCHFVFSDGADTATNNLDSVYFEPLYVNEPTVPLGYRLSQNYPNPFNSETNIAFALAKPAKINLTVYDISGRMIKTLADGHMDASAQNVVWNGRDETGQSVSSGIYFYRLNIDGIIRDTKRMVLLK